MRLALLLIPFAALTVVSGCSEARRLRTPDEGLSTDTLAGSIHRQVNATRQAQGLEPFDRSGELAEMAQRHSADMVARRYFSHVSPDGATPAGRAEAGGVDCRVRLRSGEYQSGALENLHRSSLYRSYTESFIRGRLEWTYDWYTFGEVARRVVDGWLGSPGHRRNLLDPSAKVHGVGVAADGESQVFATQVLQQSASGLTG